MKKHLSHLLIITLSLCCCLSCDPQRYCTEAKCAYSDVDTEIKSTLSGNLDSIINIGDTIRLYMKIPDTMQTNYADIIFGRLLPNSFFWVQVNSFDSTGVVPRYYNQQTIAPILIKSSTMPDKRTITWNYNTREYECLIIPNHKGKYIMKITNGRIEMATNDRTWLVNPFITLPSNIDLHHEFGIKWFPADFQDVVRNDFKKQSHYCFEVK